MKQRWFSSRTIRLPLLCLLLSGIGHAQGKPPVLIGFSPTQAAAGSTVTINFSGSNFVARSMNLIFTPSQGITVSKLQVVSPMQMSAQVQIDPAAQPGSRQVLLIDGDHNLPTPQPFTITAATPSCPPGMLSPNGGCITQPSPAIREFSPLQGTQGKTVAITLTGVNFSAPVSLQFMPNSGITVQSTTLTNANQIQAQISIAPNASLGARGVVLTLGSGKTRVAASNTFTVVSGAVLSHALPMQILRVVPNQIAAGSQNVDVTLQGTNFVPGTQVTFTVGAGVPAAVVANGAARYVNSTEMHVSVSALPAALPGGRDINLQGPGQQSVVGKGMLNVLAVKQSGPPTVLKIPPITLQSFPLGIIVQDGPLGPETSSDGYGTYAVPLLNDSSVFQWHEQNPGLADYYELRIYSQDGKTLLATQQIKGHRMPAMGGWVTVVPTYYRPAPAFLKEVLDPVQRKMFPGLIGLMGSPASPGKTPVISVAASPGSTMPHFPPDQLSGLLSQGQLQWEVAGFHTYNKNGVAPSATPPANSKGGAQNAVSVLNLNVAQSAAQNSANQSASGGTVDIEVEISNRWPLLAPKPPTGMQCSGTGMTTGVQAVNIADKNVYDANGKVTGVDQNDYVGDPWALQGNFSLAQSPYEIKFTPQTAPPPNCKGPCFGYVAAVKFDNIFVDWGDGTVEPLTAPPVEPPPPNQYSLGNWTPAVQLSYPMNSTSPMKHTYQSPNGYTVRVFQLSEGDLQHVSVGSVSASVDGPTTPFMQTALLSKMASTGAVKSGLTLTGVQTNFQQMLGGGNSGTSPAAQVASDAYMLYCHTINVTVVEDLVADGPLHLTGIADPDFGAYDVRKGVLAAGGLRKNSPLGGPAAKSTAPMQVAKTPPPAAGSNPPNLEKEKLGPVVPGAAPVAAVCSTCDDGMDATSYLSYYGTGLVRVTWIVDGTQSQQNMTLVPSPKRMNLPRQAFTRIQFAGSSFERPVPEPRDQDWPEPSDPFAGIAGAAGGQSQRDGRGRRDAQPDDAESLHRCEPGAGIVAADCVIATDGIEREQQRWRQTDSWAQPGRRAVVAEHSGTAGGQQFATAQDRSPVADEAKLIRIRRRAICKWSAAAGGFAVGKYSSGPARGFEQRGLSGSGVRSQKAVQISVSGQERWGL